jgi:hypothetical protein
MAFPISAVGPKMLKTGSPFYRMAELLLDVGIAGCLYVEEFFASLTAITPVVVPSVKPYRQLM